MININQHSVKATIFPDKTSQVWHLAPEILEMASKPDEEFVVFWRFESEAEYVHVAQIAAWLRLRGKLEGATLYLPYLPYARQDKFISESCDTSFALFPFLDLLAHLGFGRVVTVDPHCLGLFKANPGILGQTKLEIIPADGFIRAAIAECNAQVVVYPDKGARDRYKTVLMDPNSPAYWSIHLDKNRDQDTGEVTGLKVAEGCTLPPEVSIKTCHALIVDDICDGGATFIRSAKLLQELGFTKIHLYVTHGLFTKGLNVLREAGIDKIFTQYGKLL